MDEIHKGKKNEQEDIRKEAHACAVLSSMGSGASAKYVLSTKDAVQAVRDASIHDMGCVLADLSAAERQRLSAVLQARSKADHSLPYAWLFI